MTELSSKKCIPCQGGVPPLTKEQYTPLLDQLVGWSVVDDHLLKTYGFPDFVQALTFVNKVGAVAEEEGHHPDLFLTWGRVEVEIWTHKIGGLTESDFILAAKIDVLSLPPQPSAG